MSKWGKGYGGGSWFDSWTTPSYSKSKYVRKVAKDNIVDPELSYWAESDLRWALKKNVDKLPADLRELDAKGVIPEDILQDIYKTYNYPADETVYVNLDKPELEWKKKLIDKVGSYYMRGITRNNDLYSTIVTQKIHNGLLRLMHQYMKNQCDNGNGEGNKGGSGKPGLQDMIDSMSDKDFEDMVDQATQDASKTIDDLEKRLSDMVPGKQAGKMLSDPKTMEYIDRIDEFGKIYRVNPAELSKFVNGCYKHIVDYYNANSVPFEEPLIEADAFDEFDEFEQLLPILKLSGIEDMTVLSHKHNFKFDIYIDASGSMSDTINLNGRSVALYELSRFVAIKLNSLGLVNRIHLFDGRVRLIDGVFQLMTSSWGGGTNFNEVIKSIEANNVPAVILTDMCDHISKYQKGAFFIGMQTFRPQATAEVLKSYEENKQFITFDSKGFRRPKKGVDY